MDNQPTLRDQFAMAALTALLSGNEEAYLGSTADREIIKELGEESATNSWRENWTKLIAKWAYEYADAMMEAGSPACFQKAPTSEAPALAPTPDQDLYEKFLAAKEVFSCGKCATAIMTNDASLPPIDWVWSPKGNFWVCPNCVSS